jgi:hypothetical protein
MNHTAYCHYYLCSTLYLGGTLSNFGLEWMSLPPPHVNASRGWQLSLLYATIAWFVPWFHPLDQLWQADFSHALLNCIFTKNVAVWELGQLFVQPHTQNLHGTRFISLHRGNSGQIITKEYSNCIIFTYFRCTNKLFVVDYPFSPPIMNTGKAFEYVRLIDPSAQFSSTVHRIPISRYLTVVTFWYLPF